jgi:hypothetical protein
MRHLGSVCPLSLIEDVPNTVDPSTKCPGSVLVAEEAFA